MEWKASFNTRERAQNVAAIYSGMIYDDQEITVDLEGDYDVILQNVSYDLLQKHIVPMWIEGGMISIKPTF